MVPGPVALLAKGRPWPSSPTWSTCPPGRRGTRLIVRRVEDTICRLRDSGFERFPFTDLDANRWLAEACFADALVR